MSMIKKDETQKTAILVAGMHRSGTSALTRVLSFVGCSLPKTIVGPDSGNEAGHWEPEPVRALNDEILQFFESSWNDWKALDQARFNSTVMNQFRERALSILEKEYGSSLFFIIKDPRICRLLPFWLDVLKRFNAKTLIILPIRNPLDVATSLKVRNKNNSSIGLLIWLRYVLDAEFYSYGLKRAYIRFENLFVNPHNIINQLRNIFEIDWPKQNFSSVDFEISNFLQPRLHHHRSKDINLYHDHKLSQWIPSTFEIMNRWADGKILSTDKNNLNKIRIAFDEATLLFDESMSEQQATISEQEATISEQQATISEQEATISEQEATISRLLNSRSYRITIPLRYLMKFMRKLKSKIHS